MLFIFDMDQVLYRYDWRTRMHGLTDLTGWDFHELRRRWWHDEGEWLAEAGTPDTAEGYLAAVNEALEASIDVDTWLANRRAAMTPLPDMVDVARHAKNHGTITLLTNNGALIGKHLDRVAHELHPVFEDHLHATAHYRARKPDPVVFSRVLEAYGGSPETTFFIDDHPDNIRSAQSLGIESMWFGPQHDATDARGAIDSFVASRS